MRKISDLPLWLGHSGDANNIRLVMDTGIQAIIDLAANEKPIPMPREIIVCRFPMLDGAGNPPWLIQHAINCATDLLRNHIATLIYCSAGMSRTPMIAGAAVAKLKSWSLMKGIQFVVGNGPADLSPGLLNEVTSVFS